MTVAEMARHVGKALCEAWGLDPDKVQRIVISLDAGNIAIAEVSIITDGEMTEELLRLRPIDPEHSDGFDAGENDPCIICGHPRPEHYAWSTECARNDGTVCEP
jgi:hypothetical protein